MVHPNEEMIDHVVAVLNGALEADRDAISELMFTRVKVNTQELVDHPTIQVGNLDDDPEGDCYVGPLGLINGLCGVDERSWGFICMVTGKDGKIGRFARLLPDHTVADP